MLTIYVHIRDVYLEVKYEVLGVLLEFTVDKLNECSEQLDAEGMAYYNKICKALIMEREKVFEKRLNNILMKRGY